MKKPFSKHVATSSCFCSLARPKRGRAGLALVVIIAHLAEKGHVVSMGRTDFPSFECCRYGVSCSEGRVEQGCAPIGHHIPVSPIHAAMVLSQASREDVRVCARDLFFSENCI